MTESHEHPDWVRARASCNVSTMFDALREIVEVDVASANKNLPNLKAQIEQLGGPTKLFRVFQANGNARRFRIEGGTAIVVRNADNQDVLKAKPKMVDLDCLLEVDEHEEPMRLWEFSRLALEPMFFESAW